MAQRVMRAGPWMLCLLACTGALMAAAASARAQDAAPPPGAAGQPPPGEPQPGAPDAPAGPRPPQPNTARVQFASGNIDYPRIDATDVVIEMGEYRLTGGRVEGSFDEELTFTGSPVLTYRDQVVTGDAIRFRPRSRIWSVTNLHTALSAELLRGRLLSPLYLSGEALQGRARRDPTTGTEVDVTTCELPDPHYLVQASSIRVEPGQRVILKRARIDLWGRRLVTLPTLVIPLDRDLRQLRMQNAPRVGRSYDEGWFAKSAFHWLAADRIPGLLRLDVMEKKGVGTGLDLDWRLLKSVGALALYAIPTRGLTRDVSARLNQRQDIGGGQAVTLAADYRNEGYLGLPQTTTLNSRFGFTRLVGGANTSLTLGRQSSSSDRYQSRSTTANLSQTVRWGSAFTASLNADYSRYQTESTSTAGATFAQLTERLTARMQADQRAPNYTLQLIANRDVPMGGTAAGFTALERLPELNLNSYRFTGGELARLPAVFNLSAGHYSEGGTLGASAARRTVTERVVAGFDLSDTRLALTRSTDLHVAGGFQQYLYGEGSAQYMVRSSTTLTQRWGRRSGINLAYAYQRPEGGTPFRFDQLGEYHTLNADVGFLDDGRLQLTARVGYDFSRSAFEGYSQPWQTLSANLLVRPFDWMRLRGLLSYDPNTGRMAAVTTQLRLRGARDFAVDATARYDPNRHRVGSVNGYLHVPVGSDWRITALFRYNGYLGRFESRNLQIVRDLHCMEASLTYIDNPYGFRTDRQVFFQLRIKAFPVFQRMGIGQQGQSLDTSLGEIY